MTNTRVLFITEEYPPVVGGVGVSSERVSKNLALAGCKVKVLTFDSSRPLIEGDYTITETADAVEIHRLGPFFIRQPQLQLERLPEAIRATFRRRIYDQMERIATEFAPQIILSFNAVNAGLLGTYLARSLDIPHIVSLRGVDIGRNIFSFIELSVLRTIVDGSARIVCVNEYLSKRLLMAFPDAKSRAQVIHNAVDVPREISPSSARRYLNEHTNWKASDLVAVFIGTPREKKGISVLLEAVNTARMSVPIRLLIVGPSVRSEDPRCGSMAQSLTVGGFLHCTGHRPRLEALQILAEGDLIVMPSLEDGLANGLLEGMAIGLCPVVTDIFSDVVDSQCGYIVSRNDPIALANALILAASSPSDRMAFGAAAREQALKKHALAVETGAYMSVISELTNG